MTSSAPMRVLFVNENIGGHATLHAHLGRQLAGRSDVDAEFVDLAAPGLIRRVVGAGVPGLARLDADLQPLRLQLAQSAVARRELRQRARAVDVVHVYSQNAALLSARILATMPSVVSTDSTNEQNGYMLPYRRPTRATPWTIRATRRFEDRVFASATTVVAQSEWAARSLRADYGVARVEVIPFGIDVPAEPARAESTTRPEITFVGASMDRKGGWALLDAFRARLQGRAVLNLVTRTPVPETDGVRVFGDIRPGDGRVGEILSRTAVFAFPSFIDKSSYAVLEAMAMGVPVVAARAGAIAEVVIDGETGLLIDDVSGLVVALEDLIDDPRFRVRLGRAGRARVEAYFSASVTTDRLVDVLDGARSAFTRPAPAG